MSQEDLLKKVAQLESVNDYLISELEEINTLLKKVGFREGTESLKEGIKEILEDEEMEV